VFILTKIVLLKCFLDWISLENVDWGWWRILVFKQFGLFFCFGD
jgi:hypothetical protein